MNLRPWLGMFAVLWMAGCSSFGTRWAKVAATQLTDPYAGAYDGRWVSAKHQIAAGRLRCIFTPKGPSAYEAEFRANWKIFASSYTATFQTAHDHGVLHFKGEQDLGALFGGVYHYDGTVDHGVFRAKYACKEDFGRFEMTRKLTKPVTIP